MLLSGPRGIRVAVPARGHALFMLPAATEFMPAGLCAALQTHKELCDGVVDIARRVQSDPQLTSLIRRKFAIKCTTGVWCPCTSFCLPVCVRVHDDEHGGLYFTPGAGLGHSRLPDGWCVGIGMSGLGCVAKKGFSGGGLALSPAPLTGPSHGA